MLNKSFSEAQIKPEKKRRYFFDMDGVVAEYNFALPRFDMLYDEGYFLSRPPQNNIVDAVKEMISRGESVFILSAVLKDSEYALFEKHEWLDRFIPMIDCKHRIFTLCGEDKIASVPHFDPETDILIDDYGPNCRTWAGSDKSGGRYVKVSVDADDAEIERSRHDRVIHPEMCPEEIIKIILEA